MAVAGETCWDGYSATKCRTWWTNGFWSAPPTPLKAVLPSILSSSTTKEVCAVGYVITGVKMEDGVVITLSDISARKEAGKGVFRFYEDIKKG
ncbi:MAG: hypothetical protein HQL36_01445 [Alphaproteobacteria bacterium]|nr:hypothetical protein [Alphaproteobacteria bacterium]MBF0249855.1 hypothetical protein [Alphaproteobacteria bacterium]